MKELYLNRSPYVFLGVSGDPSKVPYSIVGVPFDSTSSFRSGSRFAPLHIRLISQSLETYSLRADVDVEDFPPYDEGDVIVSPGDASWTFRAIEEVSGELFSSDRRPIFIGGDHIVSVPIITGAVKALGKDLCVILLDAHLDFRDSYLGNKFSHACVTRRLSEVLDPKSILVVGARAFSKSELYDARRLKLKYYTTLDVRRLGVRGTAKAINDFTSSFSRIYISVDLDIFDPAYAPGVQTPEPDGLSPGEIFDILYKVVDSKVVGLDIVEVCPPHDVNDITSALAAKTVLEVISYMHISQHQ
ncbi:MAG: agmatinase [Desulfurococcales archaeon]|nr:agmatinase [Desulfurococcales archaeon]